MTEPGKVSARYRELAREEPSSALDARILAASREIRRPARPQWMVPLSIAAVLVLGIGVSLRMQLEQPGIETSLPAPAAPTTPAAPEPSQPVESQVLEQAPARQDAAPAPSKPKLLRKERAAAPPPVEEAKRHAEAESVPRPFPDAPAAQAPAPPPPAAAANVAAPPPLPAAQAPARADPAVTLSSVAPAPRAKLEAGIAADSSGGAREMRRAAAEPDPDPLRELERIAGLRAAGNNAEADRALEQFRRRHPDFRIPEALWERVRPR